MTESGANNSGRLISCSFCEEKLSPSSVGDHLMMCGNKTDQCPHCRKFIRRAIFAYHYENNCADLDAIDNDVNATATQFDAPAAFQGNVSSHSSSGEAAGYNKQVTSIKVDLSTHPTIQNDISHRLDSDFCDNTPITMQCPFCKQKCEIGEREIHQENCLQNPANITKSQQPKINRTSNSISNRLNHLDQSDDIDNIPCEYCNEPIKWNHYKDHTKACGAREFERRQNQSRTVPVEANVLMIRCKYCCEERIEACISIHEAMCLAASDTRYIRLYRPPPLYH